MNNISSTQEKITNLVFYLSILLFFLGFNFTDNPPSGWYLQTLPNLNGKTISDVFFLDSLTGWAATGTNSGPGNINYILKTTNGGDNWWMMFADTCFFSSIQFTDNMVGYASGGSGGGRAYFYQTTNGGINWNRLWNTGASEFDDMTLLNKDTIWVVDHDGLTGGVFRTTNGGLNWTQQPSGSGNPDKIYMYNARIGFIVDNTGGNNLRKTTDGGDSWFTVVSGQGFYDMKFIDSLTGWRAKDYIKKTTDGGLTWVEQPFPQGGNGYTLFPSIRSFTILNKDSIWGGYGVARYPNLFSRGILLQTTNGGTSWRYQIPDTSFQMPRYKSVQFMNAKTGWAYLLGNGIHTTTGGDTTFLTAVNQISIEVPKDFMLFQNYPNPFNAISKIKYKISKSSEIRISVYNIMGKEVAVLLNEKKNPGEYSVSFDGNNLSSGMYFYSLIVDGKVVDTKKAMLLK